MSENMLYFLTYKKELIMSITQSIKQQIQHIQRGKPFTHRDLLSSGSRASIDQAMSRLVKQGTVMRVCQGVFVRPKQSRWVGNVMPDVDDVLEAIAKKRGEVIQVHGAEAARTFRISTQVPMIPVYYTNGSSREILVGKLKVKLIHTSDQRKLQCAGTRVGLALAALWYLGKNQVNRQVLSRIHDNLNAQEFQHLQTLSMPLWMKQAIDSFSKG
jgi:hypothetical protein